MSGYSPWLSYSSWSSLSVTIFCSTRKPISFFGKELYLSMNELPPSIKTKCPSTKKSPAAKYALVPRPLAGIGSTSSLITRAVSERSSVRYRVDETVGVDGITRGALEVSATLDVFVYLTYKVVGSVEVASTT